MLVQGVSRACCALRAWSHEGGAGPALAGLVQRRERHMHRKGLPATLAHRHEAHHRGPQQSMQVCIGTNYGPITTNITVRGGRGAGRDEPAPRSDDLLADAWWDMRRPQPLRPTVVSPRPCPGRWARLGGTWALQTDSQSLDRQGITWNREHIMRGIGVHRIVASDQLSIQGAASILRAFFRILSPPREGV